MNQITRYIFRQLVVGTILITLGLMCLVWLTQSLRYVELIVNRGLSATLFLHLTLLLLPSFLALIMPIGVFAMVLFVYNRLLADRELVVLRAAGWNQQQIARPALLLGLVCLVTGYALSLFVMPESYRAFRDLQFKIRSEFSAILLEEGVFNQITDDLTVHIRGRDPQGDLIGILVHDTRNPQRPVTMMAERGALVVSDGQPRVVMVNGSRQEVERGTGQLKMLYFERTVVDFGNFGDDTGPRYFEPRELPLKELFSVTAADVGQDNVGQHRVEAHSRLTAPLANLAYALIALAAVLGGSYNRLGQVGRVLMAVAAVALLQGGLLGIGNVVTRETDMWPLLYLHALAPGPIAWIMMMQDGARSARRTPAPQAAA
ncbi:MAG: LPS export ABC transporter permease LptF [Acetobacterales bacterium]